MREWEKEETQQRGKEVGVDGVTAGDHGKAIKYG